MVLQVAASGNVKECYGVEKAEIPAKYAEVLNLILAHWSNGIYPHSYWSPIH